MLVFSSNCFRTFLPHFMRQSQADGGFALSASSAAFHSVVWFYIGSFIGIAAGARLSDRLVRRFPAIRINMLWIGLAISAPAMAAMVYMPSLWACLLMTFAFGLGGGLFDCSLYSGLFLLPASATPGGQCFCDIRNRQGLAANSSRKLVIPHEPENHPLETVKGRSTCPSSVKCSLQFFQHCRHNGISACILFVLNQIKCRQLGI